MHRRGMDVRFKGVVAASRVTRCLSGVACMGEGRLLHTLSDTPVNTAPKRPLEP